MRIRANTWPLRGGEGVTRAKFYALSFTWGLPMALVGLVSALALILTRHRCKRWGHCLSFNVGQKMGSWGGVSLGFVIVTDMTDDASLKNHEYGHAIQNCFYGPLMPFIVCIPSFVRYWYREIRRKLGLGNKTGYYDIWFERQASEWGEKYIEESR